MKGRYWIGLRQGPRAYRGSWRRYGRWSWPRRPYWAQGPASWSLVAWAQQHLAVVFGPVVPQDGVFGPETRGFVQRFQMQQGLAATGNLDDATVAALQAVISSGLPPMPPPPPGFGPPPPDFGPPPPVFGPPPPGFGLSPAPPGEPFGFSHPHRHRPPRGAPPVETHHHGPRPPDGPHVVVPAAPAPGASHGPAPAPPPQKSAEDAAARGGQAKPRPAPHEPGVQQEMAAGPAATGARGRWRREGNRIFLFGV